jgi:hypothetical protein
MKHVRVWIKFRAGHALGRPFSENMALIRSFLALGKKYGENLPDIVLSFRLSRDSKSTTRRTPVSQV